MCSLAGEAFSKFFPCCLYSKVQEFYSVAIIKEEVLPGMPAIAIAIRMGKTLRSPVPV